MYFDFMDSPIGKLRIISNGNAVISVSLVKKFDASIAQCDSFTDQCITELKEYFDGSRDSFEVPVDYSNGTSFCKQVWKAVAKVKHGHTRSYLQIARDIDNPKAVRAVGLANNKNPLPILIPCHRIIGSDGRLVGYGYGLEIKQKLLMLENPKIYGMQNSLF